MAQLIDKDAVLAEIDFEQELYKAFGHVKDFTLCLKIARRFYEMGRNHQEPVSEDFTKALTECIHKAQCSVVDPLAHAEVWKKELVKLAKCEEPVSEDLGEYIDKLSKQFPEVSFAKLSRIAVRVAKWQKKQDQETIELAEEHAMLAGMKKMEEQMTKDLWKPADGDDLPEIGREVVAFQEIFPTNVDVPSLFKIVVTHRPNPEGYDGKSIATGEIEHYTPKTYDKGGWNIPDIVCWLDVELPKEIEP